MICNCSCFDNTHQQEDSAESCFEEEIDGEGSDEYEEIFSEDDTTKKKPKKTSKKKTYKQQFRMEWTTIYPWLIKKDKGKLKILIKSIDIIINERCIYR